MRREIARVVIDDAVRRGDFGAADLADLALGRGAVQAGRNQDRDPLPRDSGLLEPPQHRRKRQAVRRGTGDVANGNRRALLAAREFGERRRADGTVERGFERCLPVGKRLGAAGLQHPIAEFLGKLDGQSRSFRKRDRCASENYSERARSIV